MSGGAFDYKQYQIDDIVEKLEQEIEDATKERPKKVNHSEVCVWQYGKSAHGYTYGRSLSHYNFKTLDEARKYFEGLGYTITEVDEKKFKIENYDVGGDWLDVYLSSWEEYEDGGYYPDYKPETIQEFRNAVEILKKASVYVQRIDWFLSGDDSEDTFHERLNKELNELKS